MSRPCSDRWRGDRRSTRPATTPAPKLLALLRSRYYRSGIPDGLGLDERQEISIDRIGFRGGHAVREALVGFQRSLLQQLGTQRRRVGIGHDLIIIAVHHECRDRDLL